MNIGHVSVFYLLIWRVFGGDYSSFQRLIFSFLASKSTRISSKMSFLTKSEQVGLVMCLFDLSLQSKILNHPEKCTQL